MYFTHHLLTSVVINNNNINNLYCALDTKSVKTLKGNNCKKKESTATQK